MEHIFDEVINRRNTGSLKWDTTSERELPMWVADMDFRTAPCVMEAVVERARQGVYGYAILPDEWYLAYQNWWDSRHGFRFKREWIIFSTGVVPAISSIVRSMTNADDYIVTMTPVYDIFFHSILNHHRKVLENRLRYENGVYSVDFEDLEEKLANPKTTMLIFCNPHNPTGMIWDRGTIERIGALCVKHDVLVLSDEIHCDITKPGIGYVPYASVSETCRDHSITCVSPTKAFNLAGIQTSAVIVPNPDIRRKVDRGLNTDEVAEPNVFAVTAPVAAFEKGEAWLYELQAYLWENRLYAEAYLARELPELCVVHGRATYLLWIDANGLPHLPEDVCEYVRKTSGLVLSDGREYRNADGFLRMNLACPRSVLTDGLERLKKSCNLLKTMK